MMLFAACLVPLDAGPRLRPSSLARIALTDGFLLRRPCRVAAPDAAPWIAGQRGGIRRRLPRGSSLDERAKFLAIANSSPAPALPPRRARSCARGAGEFARPRGDSAMAAPTSRAIFG